MDREFILYLHSSHSADIYPDNHPQNFSIHLKRPIHLEGDWECALVQFSFGSLSEAGYYVCCDVLAESHTGDFMLPVLRRVRDRAWQFKNLLYVPVKSRDFSTIHMYLRTWQNSEPVFVRGQSYCTLHFRRVK